MWTNIAISLGLNVIDNYGPVNIKEKIYECNFDENNCDGFLFQNGPNNTLKVDRSFYAFKPDLYRITDFSSISKIFY